MNMEWAEKRKRKIKAAEIMGYAHCYSDDFMICRGIQWLGQKGTLEINRHKEGYSISCVAENGVSGSPIIQENLADGIADTILNIHYDESNPNLKSCIVCGEELLPVYGNWDTYQPEKQDK